MIQTIKNTAIKVLHSDSSLRIIEEYKKAGVKGSVGIQRIGTVICCSANMNFIVYGGVPGNRRKEITLEQLIEFNNRNNKPEEFVTDDGLVVFKKARVMEVWNEPESVGKRARKEIYFRNIQGAWVDGDYNTWDEAREIQPEKVKLSKAQYEAIQSGNYEITD